MAVEIDGAMQQAPQPGRQFMAVLVPQLAGAGDCAADDRPALRCASPTIAGYCGAMAHGEQDSVPVFVVTNPKGGVGKGTVATNLAGYFACRGERTILGDLDWQQSSLFDVYSI